MYLTGVFNAYFILSENLKDGTYYMMPILMGKITIISILKMKLNTLLLCCEADFETVAIFLQPVNFYFYCEYDLLTENNIKITVQ